MQEWRLIGRIADDDQRLWQGQGDDYYLADESGDRYRIGGNPDETDDGPCRILKEEPIQLYANGLLSVCVVVERTGRESSIVVTPRGASFLVERLNMKVQLGDVVLVKEVV